MRWDITEWIGSDVLLVMANVFEGASAIWGNGMEMFVVCAVWVGTCGPHVLDHSHLIVDFRSWTAK